MRLLYVKPELRDLSQSSRIAFVRQLRHLSQESRIKFVRIFRHLTQDNISDDLGLTEGCKRRSMARYETSDRNTKTKDK